MKTTLSLVSIAALFTGFTGWGCGQKSDEQAAAPAPAAPAPAAPAPAAPAAAAPADAQLPPVPPGAKVFFVEPADGAKIEGPLENGKVAVAIKMGAEGIAVKPAGPVEAGSGHHHVLIDVDPEPMGSVVGKDEQHLHFGKGQTEATLELAPGEHTLRLQFADGIHRSYGPALSASIKINVVAAGTAPSTAEKSGKPSAPEMKSKKRSAAEKSGK